MTLNGRLNRLEKALADEREAEEAPAWLELAFDRAEQTMERLRELLPAQLLQQVLPLVVGRLQTLVWAAENRWKGEAWYVRWSCGWAPALAHLVERTPEDLRARVIGALGRGHDGGGELHTWLVYLAGRHWRLPPDIDPQVLRELVRIHLEEPLSGLDDTCVGCGLKLPVRRMDDPYANGRFFEECPHCHGRDFWPSGRVEEKPFVWKQLLAVELPGGETNDLPKEASEDGECG
jgi:hypothetical protein